MKEATAGVGAVVRALREALGLTQGELAERSGFPSHVYVTRVERGMNRASSYKMREALAKGFGLSMLQLDQLLAGDLTVAKAVRASSVATQPPRAKRGGSKRAVKAA